MSKLAKKCRQAAKVDLDFFFQVRIISFFNVKARFEVKEASWLKSDDAIVSAVPNYPQGLFLEVPMTPGMDVEATFMVLAEIRYFSLTKIGEPLPPRCHRAVTLLYMG